MLTSDAHISEISPRIRTNKSVFLEYINEVCNRVEVVEPELWSLVPETDRRVRLLREAGDLHDRCSCVKSLPPLYGVLVGVKDIIRVDGFPTRCGSYLPEDLFSGPEALCVRVLRQAGALILGKTVTATFAHREPGPTRNPHNLEHTPGGSSSGSAAAVAAGLCPVALGTQTIGSVIRPGAYCGVVGFTPSYGRIVTSGVVPFSPSVDQIGMFTQDIDGMIRVAALLCSGWNEKREEDIRGRLPVLMVPEGPYMQQASPPMLSLFEDGLRRLEDAGYTIRARAVLGNIGEITAHHTKMIAAEIAQGHAQWFDRYGDLYPRVTAEFIREGRRVSSRELEEARRHRTILRGHLETIMNGESIDLWVTPATTETAPRGLSSTGDPAMNLPWTHAGMPTVTIPSGVDDGGVPYGLQFSGRFMDDEMVLFRAREIETVLRIKQKHRGTLDVHSKTPR